MEISDLSKQLDSAIADLDSKKQAADEATKSAARATEELKQAQDGITKLRAEFERVLDEKMGISRSSRVR